MKPPIAALFLLLFCSAHAVAESPIPTDTKTPPTVSEARKCVVAGNTWKKCLGLPSSYSITAFSTYKPQIDFSDHPLAKPEGFKLRPPWSRSAVDFLMDPHFSGSSHLARVR